MAFYDYRIAVGHGVALGSLTNVETFFYTYTRPKLIAPVSQPVNLYPILQTALDGSAAGEGAITHEWVIDVMPIAGLNAWEDTYLTTGGVIMPSKPVTIYTRRQNQLVYTRYNAHLHYSQPGIDYRYTRRSIREWVIRFTALEAL